MVENRLSGRKVRSQSDKFRICVFWLTSVTHSSFAHTSPPARNTVKYVADMSSPALLSQDDRSFFFCVEWAPLWEGELVSP